MAPEQWEGQPQDARTDQYALGVTAYELLAGRLPFEGDDAEVLRTAVINGRVRDIEGIPVVAMQALRRALAKNPKERFANCGEFVTTLVGERAGIPPAGETRKEREKGTADGDVFLRKVRLGRELESAEKENAIPQEKSALEEIRELFIAGEEALRAGQNEAAGGLFAQMEERLAAWRKWRKKRREEAEIRLKSVKDDEERRRNEEETQGGNLFLLFVFISIWIVILLMAMRGWWT